MNDADRALYEHLGEDEEHHDPDDPNCPCQECRDKYEDMIDNL